ncbi:hypothetical protein BaRGS_00024357 [Batillaria attramentaria]|uniref:Alpha-amylase n=1 Tax=Batillaria attramentaria TaxID=370345 RepID=A0ABD0KBF2_9CAEN
MMLPIALSLLLLVAATASDFGSPHCATGRTTIVELFEWRWDDVAAECERFLGPMGFCGVQVSPPNENAVVSGRPWTERYQPASYQLTTRSGDEASFRDMVARCNNASVRIYADAVINHMADTSQSGVGNGRNDSWDFNDWGTGCYTGDQRIYNYGDTNQVRNCRYEGRADLRLSKDYVRGKLAEFMNNLITIGVAGFRVDSAKHMWPGDLENIFGRLQRPFIYQHVPDYDDNEAIRAYEYTNNGRVTNFRFGKYLNDVFRRQNALKWLSNFGEGWNMPASDDVLNFIDNHDNQRDTSAGSVLTYKQSRLYKMATAFMLAWPYGVARVMSSYNFTDATQGPPSTNEVTDRVVINGDGGCDGGWVCEHRWRQVYNMVAFRNVAGSEPVANWWTGADYQIAFSRGNRTFIAFNLESFDFKATLQTGLPAGWYCDVISGHLDNDKCTGATVIVREDGTAKVSICGRSSHPFVAIHIGQKIGNEVKTLG